MIDSGCMILRSGRSCLKDEIDREDVEFNWSLSSSVVAGLFSSSAERMVLFVLVRVAVRRELLVTGMVIV